MCDAEDEFVIHMSDGTLHSKKIEMNGNATLSWRIRQAWQNALFSENIDHSKSAQPGAE